MSYSMIAKPEDFMGYFENEVEYPRNIAFNPLPLNTMWWYISEAFLNGFINYVEIVEAHLLDRYTERDEDITERFGNHTYQEPAGSLKWTAFEAPITKQKVLDIATQPKRMMHSKLSMFRDDVLILAKAKDDDGVQLPNETMYVFFWFDMDNSDCGIGRFVTSDTEEVVVQKFRDYIKERKFTSQQIPNHFFEGWISF
jgi:hypothetical protein